MIWYDPISNIVSYLVISNRICMFKQGLHIVLRKVHLEYGHPAHIKRWNAVGDDGRQIGITMSVHEPRFPWGLKVRPKSKATWFADIFNMVAEDRLR